MSESQALPSTLFDHVLWTVRGPDGHPRGARIAHGECILLFSSLDALHGYLDRCEDGAEWQPTVFSRSRKDFGRGARVAARDGMIGALIDPTPSLSEAPFLPFARVSKDA